MTTPNNPGQAQQGLTPDSLAEQLFNIAISQNTKDPHEAGRQVIEFIATSLFYAIKMTKNDVVVFLTDALIRVIHGSAPDDNTRVEMLKHVSEIILGSANLQAAAPIAEPASPPTAAPAAAPVAKPPAAPTSPVAVPVPVPAAPPSKPSAPAAAPVVATPAAPPKPVVAPAPAVAPVVAAPVSKPAVPPSPSAPKTASKPATAAPTGKPAAKPAFVKPPAGKP